MFRFSDFFVQTVVLIGVILEVCNGLSGEEAVRQFFQYFKKDNPHGIPVLNLGEPLELYSPLETVPVTLYNGTLEGHSQILIKSAFVDFNSLMGGAKIIAPLMKVSGNYSWPGFYFTSEGFMTANISSITIACNFTMFIDEYDEIQITDLKINQESTDVEFHMTNLIWEHRTIINSGAVHVFFDEIVLEMFRQLQPFLISEANLEISKFVATLPEVKSFVYPEDLKTGLLDGPKKSKTFKILFKRLANYLGMEPLFLPEQSSRIIGVKFKVTDMVIHGISTVDTLHSMFAVYQENKLYVEASMTHPVLFLYYNVMIDTADVMNWDMHQKVQLNQVFIKFRLVFDPSLKTPPKIVYFDIDVESFGRIHSRRRESIWGRMIQFFSKIDDAVMGEVVNLLQGPIMKIIQNDLNRMDIEEALIHLVKKN